MRVLVQELLPGDVTRGSEQTVLRRPSLPGPHGRVTIEVLTRDGRLVRRAWNPRTRIDIDRPEGG